MLRIDNYPGLIEINIGRYFSIAIWKKPSMWELGFDKYDDGWTLNLAIIEFDYHTEPEPKFDCQRKECPADCTGCYENFYKEESPL